MSYVKDVLFAIQQNEKKYQQDKMEVTHDPLLKEYIQYLKNKIDRYTNFLSELSEAKPAPGVTGGTSYSAPFFVALFACYKQELNISDNQVILDHILSKCVKSNETYFGYGLPTF